DAEILFLTPRKRFTAWILFLDPNDAPGAIATLLTAGCEFQYDPDAIDDYGPTVFGTVTGTTELDENGLYDWLMDIIGPLTGDVAEWGFDSPHDTIKPVWSKLNSHRPSE